MAKAKGCLSKLFQDKYCLSLPRRRHGLNRWSTHPSFKQRFLRSNKWHIDPKFVRYLYFCDSASPPCVIRDLAPLREAEPTFFLRGTNTGYCVWLWDCGAGEQHWLLRLLNDFGIVDKRYHNEIVSKWHKHLASQIKGRRPVDRASEWSSVAAVVI